MDSFLSSYVSWAVLAIVVVPLLTRFYTAQRYNKSLHSYALAEGVVNRPLEPPPIPYTIPFLGNARSFLSSTPGGFWSKILQTHPRSVGAFTLLLGGKRAYILQSPVPTHALLRTRHLSRHETTLQVMEKGLGAPKDDTRKFWANDAHKAEKIDLDYLLKSERVNEMTATFTKTFRNNLASDARSFDTAREINISEWVRKHMFNAATTALMGSRLLEMFPTFFEDFYRFDSEFLSLFFGLPNFLAPGAFDRRERILDVLATWNREMYQQSEGRYMDADTGPAWDPLYGNRVNRARQLYYAEQDLSFKGRAAFDLGFLFGLNSNAVPATGWMLMHILDPNDDTNLLPRVMAELATVQQEDGSLSIPKLIALPLFQSILNEVLRLYVDVLVSRDLTEDLTLPLNDQSGQQILLKKNSTIFAPSWINHHDELAWNGQAPANVFYAERFLSIDETTGEHVFSTAGTAGKLFPFGGGKTICPGRVFAKQEVLAAVAQTLLAFEFEPVGFVNEDRADAAEFPRPKKAYPGSGVLVIGGDLKVRARVRS